MLPDSIFFYIPFIVLYALGGVAIGILVGWFVAFALGSTSKRLHDAIAGALGLVLGIIAVSAMPWRLNTIHYKLASGTEVTSTSNRFQHPAWAGIGFAIVLSALYELYRWKRARTCK
jgi:hypothetical protein